MKTRHLEIDFAGIKQPSEMHILLKDIFGFPEFYGSNVHALIDCLSSLRYPKDGMTKVTIEVNEILLIRIKNISKTSESVITHFIIAIESANSRQIRIGNSPSIHLSLE